MSKHQKVLLWILFAIHALGMYICIDGYYDAIINGCAGWGPMGHCPWGGEAMGVAWASPYSYVYFISRNFIGSFAAIIFAIFMLRKRNATIAIWFLALPLLVGFCSNLLEIALTNNALFNKSILMFG